jgi:hypothetical protein
MVFLRLGEEGGDDGAGDDPGDSNKFPLLLRLLFLELLDSEVTWFPILVFLGELMGVATPLTRSRFLFIGFSDVVVVVAESYIN